MSFILCVADSLNFIQGSGSDWLDPFRLLDQSVLVKKWLQYRCVQTGHTRIVSLVTWFQSLSGCFWIISQLWDIHFSQPTRVELEFTQHISRNPRKSCDTFSFAPSCLSINAQEFFQSCCTGTVTLPVPRVQRLIYIIDTLLHVFYYTHTQRHGCDTFVLS